MKTLYIIRHAKSSWKGIGLDDFDRGLNKRGKEDLEIIGNEFRKRKIKLDKVYSSSAKRAKLTCEFLCSKIDYSLEKVIFDKKIYDYHMEGIDFYIGYIMEFLDVYNSIAIIGHNNAITELVEYFLGKDVGNMPTTGIIKINFDINKWSDVSYSNGKKDFFIYPKMFK